MSVHVSSAVWKAGIENSGQKLVLLALADIANHEGRCWPSVGTLVSMTALSDSAIRGHLKTMKESGFLEINPRSTSGGRQTSNIFRILVEKLPPPPRVPNSGTSPELEGEASKSGTPSPQNLAPQNRTQEPSKEPKKGEGGSAAVTDLFASTPAPESEAKLEAPDELPTFPQASMVRIWNEAVPGAKIQAFAGERLRTAGARWKQLGSKLEAWKAFCERVGASPFLTGKEGTGSRTFTATFDWAIMPGNFLKIQEGRYDPKSKSKPNAKKHEW